MQIEVLDAGYATQYRAMMLEAYRQHPDAFTSSETERAALPMEWWKQRLADPVNNTQERAGRRLETVIGAVSENDLLGVTGIRFHAGSKIAHKSTLFGMYTPIAGRGNGTGSALLDKAIQIARARPGINLIQLTVSEQNTAALNLYLKHGFQQFGLEPRAVAVDDGYVAKIHMWCDLQ